MRARDVALFILFLTTASLAAEGPSRVMELGEHYPIFRYEKSENPQNVMVAYVRLSKNCEFEPDPSTGSQIGLYWLMNGEKYKPVHRLIQNGIRKHVETLNQNKRSFTLRLKNPALFKDEIDSRDIFVSAHKQGARCAADAQMDIRKEEALEKVQLTRIFAETKKTLMPPFRKLLAVTFTGVNAQEGDRVDRRFRVR